MEKNYSITINDKEYHYLSTLDKSLLSYLREDLNLMGSKNGCGNGQCGACTVIVNGKAKKSCILKMSKLNGSVVQTIEGVATNGKLHPIQVAFINCGAVQCGFCTPGLIMSCKALLDDNLNPTREDINKALGSNICRCTGYNPILEAIDIAAKALRDNVELKLNLDKSGLSEEVIRKDGISKVLGKPIFSEDLPIKNSLYGELVLSKYAHANILSIDTSEAEKIDKVVRVLTYKDLPGENLIGIISKKQPVFAFEKVRFLGDPIALVLAEDKKAAIEASKLVKIEYEELTPIFDMRESENSEIKLFDDGNVLKKLSITKGDIDKGFDQSDVIVEDTITVPPIEHAYLEPDSAYAYYDENNLLTVSTQSQSSFEFREAIAKNLNLEVESVRVITNATGGAFGGREEPTVQVHAALGTYITKKPVHLVMDRYDVLLRTIKRHGEILHYKVGAKSNGKITALKANILADTGAYPSAGEAVILRSVLFSSGPYKIDNAFVEGTAVYTNSVPAGAMRGFGSNQPAIASEILMDELAKKLNMDPFELRRLNALDEGSKTIGGQILTNSVGLKSSLDIVQKMVKSYKKPVIEGKTIGIGIASGMKNVGLGSGMNDSAGVIAEFIDGHLLLKIASVDSGQGSDTVARQIGAKEFGCNLNNVDIIANDTLLTLDSGVTTASRQTYVTGNATILAVDNLKKEIIKQLIENSSCKDSDLFKFANNSLCVNDQCIEFTKLYEIVGHLRGVGKFSSLKTVPLQSKTDNLDNLSDEFRLHFAYDFGTQAAVVAINNESGKVEVLKVFAAHDVGKQINRLGVKGQIEGGILMGIGYALTEEFIINEKGLVTNSIKKIGVPTIKDATEIEFEVIENYAQEGPYGAKGIGEITMVPTTPAVINAIYDALGIRINNLPAKPNKILTELKKLNIKEKK